MTDKATLLASKRAREALAAEYERDGATYKAREVRSDNGADTPENLRALRAIDTATSTLLDEIEARVRGLKKTFRRGEINHLEYARNAALDEALAAIASIQGME